MADKRLTRDQVKGILDSLPSTTSKQTALQNLVKSGYVLEGLNDKPSGLQARTQTQSSTEEKPSLWTNLKNDYAETVGNVTSDFSKPGITSTNPLLNPFVADSNILAEAAGGINKMTGHIVESAYGLLPESVRSSVMQNITNALGGQKNVETISGVIGAGQNAWNAFSDVMPDQAKQLGRLGNLATLYAGGEGGVAAKGAVTPVLERATKPIADFAEKSALKLGTKKPVTINSVAEYVMPKVNKGVATDLAKAGEVGTVKKGLILSQELPAPQPEHFEMAEAVKGVVDPNATLARNIDAVNADIKTSATLLKDSLKEAPGNWNINSVKGELKKIKQDIPKGFVGDNEKIYQRVIDAFVDEIGKTEGRTWDSLWDARIRIDQLIKDQFGDIPFENTGARDKAIRAARNAINNYIEKNTKDVGFKARMRRFTNEYNVLDNLVDKRATEILENSKKTGKQLFIEKHPYISAGLGTIFGGALGGTAAKYIP